VTQGPLSGPGVTDEGRLRFEQRRALLEDALRDRFDRAITAGELPRDTSSRELACFYAIGVGHILLWVYKDPEVKMATIVRRLSAGMPSGVNLVLHTTLRTPRLRSRRKYNAI
jgi:hypothetical protein